LDVGAVKGTATVVLPAITVPIVGAPGAPAAYVVMLLLTALSILVPNLLVAFTVNVYAVLADNPVIVIVPDTA
jgi:hypothetical protein